MNKRAAAELERSEMGGAMIALLVFIVVVGIIAGFFYAFGNIFDKLPGFSNDSITTGGFEKIRYDVVKGNVQIFNSKMKWENLDSGGRANLNGKIVEETEVLEAFKEVYSSGEKNKIVNLNDKYRILIVGFDSKVHDEIIIALYELQSGVMPGSFVYNSNGKLMYYVTGSKDGKAVKSPIDNDAALIAKVKESAVEWVGKTLRKKPMSIKYVIQKTEGEQEMSALVCVEKIGSYSPVYLTADLAAEVYSNDACE